jgi:hypothetical protein
MQNAQQIQGRPLECVWTLTGKGLVCSWIERTRAEGVFDRKPDREQSTERKVA